MELIVTEKGKPCALYNGYAYRKYRENKQGVVTWCCLQEKTSKCKGRIMSQDAEVIRVVDHQCVPDEASIDEKKAIFNVKKRTREESDTQIRQIYNEEFNSLQNMGYEFVTSLPQFSNVRSSLYSIRSRAQGVQKEPKQPGEVTFDEETLKMSDGNNFLLADNGVVDRILIFAGVKQREVMREKTSFFMDGTFRSCSAQFSQLYTIHVDLGSTLEETNVVPVIFALLPNKRKETYVRMFRMILEEVPNWVPDTVHIDFEASAISALREVFPSVNINGCYFHFTKCLWRQVQDIGLTNLYKEDSDVRFHIRLCAALAFLKPEDVDEGWILIQETAPSNEKLSEFFNYFVEQWLDNPTLTKEVRFYINFLYL